MKRARETTARSLQTYLVTEREKPIYVQCYSFYQNHLDFSYLKTHSPCTRDIVGTRGVARHISAETKA